MHKLKFWLTDYNKHLFFSIQISNFRYPDCIIIHICKKYIRYNSKENFFYTFCKTKTRRVLFLKDKNCHG